MSRSRRFTISVSTAFLALILTLGCSRPEARNHTRSAGGVVIDSTSLDSSTRMRITRMEAGTYIGDILSSPDRDSLLTRWPDRNGRSLRVWIQHSRITDFDSSFVPIVRSAFAAWTQAGVPITFSFVSDSAKADVHLTWVHRFKESASGKTLWVHDGTGWITEANILIALHRNDGDALSAWAIRAISLHEAGHLLGLDHTRDTLSVMAPRVQVAELSKADIATARLLYTLPAGKVDKRKKRPKITSWAASLCLG
jgi:predicted Zn-dependent protease